jgi:hypothetical protein
VAEKHTFLPGRLLSTGYLSHLLCRFLEYFFHTQSRLIEGGQKVLSEHTVTVADAIRRDLPRFRSI